MTNLAFLFALDLLATAVLLVAPSIVLRRIR